MEPRLVIIDKHAGRNVHGVDKAQPVADSALCDAIGHLARDVHELHPRGQVEPKFLAKGFHGGCRLSAIGCQLLTHAS
jgi:hypothetical protein